MIEIAPSILSADFTRLGEEIRGIEAGGAGVVHFDVMDGRFVPNITIGLPVLKSIRKTTDLPIDAHLMIVEPSRYAEQFVAAGANMVSIHAEAEPHLNRTLTAIRQAGAKAGVVVNPATSLTVIEEALFAADYVLLMSVNPGFGGQKFIPQVLNKARRLRQMIETRGLNVQIEIDGGVDEHNINEVARAEVEIVVAGSAVFGRTDLNPTQAVRKLLEAGTIWT